MTEEQARKQGLPGSDVFIRSQLAYKDNINNASFVAYLNGEALLAFKNTYALVYNETIKAEDEALTQWLHQCTTGLMPQTPYSFSRMQYINLENLLIGSAFELHFKAKLISKGYIVQIIKKAGNFKTLHKDQLKKPIHKNELFAVESYMYDSDRQTNILNGLCASSVKFKTMLKPAYAVMLDISPNICQLADYYRQLRNQIHMPGDAISTRPPTAYENTSFVDDLKLYINEHIVDYTNSLIEQNGLPATAKLTRIL